MIYNHKIIRLSITINSKLNWINNQKKTKIKFKLTIKKLYKYRIKYMLFS